MTNYTDKDNDDRVGSMTNTNLIARVDRLEEALRTVIGLSYSVTKVFNGEELSNNALLAQDASGSSVRAYVNDVLLEGDK